MEKYIYGGLILLILTGSGAAIKFYNDYKKTENDLAACKSTPDFIPSLHNVKEFIGARKRFQFKVKCRNGVDFDFTDTKHCKILLEKSINDNNSIVLTRDDYKGTPTHSSYVAEWLEYWNFSIDLSDPAKWNIHHNQKLITFSAPQIMVTRIAKSGSQYYLIYITDRAFFSNDQKALFSMSKNTDDFAEIKAKNYLNEEYQNITNEMKIAIEDFIQTLIGKMGYENGYQVNVNFEPIQI